MSDLEDGQLDLASAARVPEELANEKKQFELRAGDLLVGMSGSIDNFAVVQEDDLPCLLNQRVGRFVGTAPEICQYVYLKKVVLSPIYLRQIDMMAAGAAQRNISKSQIESVEFPLPPPPEQRRIAAVLDTVDAAIRETDAVIAKQEQVKTGLLQDLLTRGLNADGRPRDPARHPEQFRETKLGKIPKVWEVKAFGELIAQGPQNGLYKPKSAYTDGDNGFPIVRIDSFYGGVLSPEDLRRLRLTESERARYGLDSGDILINRVNSRGFIGKNAIVSALREPTVFESNIMRLKVDESVIRPIHAINLLNTPVVLRQLQRRAKDAVAQSSINPGQSH